MYYDFMEEVLRIVCNKLKGKPEIRPLKFYSYVKGQRTQKHSFWVVRGGTKRKIGSNNPHKKYAVGLRKKGVPGKMKYYLPNEVPFADEAARIIINAIT